MPIDADQPSSHPQAPADPDAVEAIAHEVVAAAVHRRTRARILTVEPLAGSVGNQDFMITTDRSDFVLKAGPGPRLIAEAWACNRVRQAGVAAPEIVTVEPAPTDLPLPFLLMRRMPGGAVSASSPALVEAGRQLRLVHSIRVPGYGGLAVDDQTASGGFPTWGDFLTEITGGLEPLVAAGVITDSLATAASATVKAAAGLQFTGDPVLVHGDLKLQHIFGLEDRFVGVIDWGDASAGDPRFDLGRLSMAGTEAFTSVLTGYGLALTDDLNRSCAAYRLVWNLDALRYEFAAGGDWFDSYRRGMESAINSLR